MGLSPPQARARRAILDSIDSGRGGVLFLGGQAGSGKSHLLRALQEELGRRRELRLAVGGLGELPSSTADEDWWPGAEAFFDQALAASASFNPALSLVAPIAKMSVAAAGLLQALTEPPSGPTELVTRVVRAAALESPKSPLVCLIDDADWLVGGWWTELQFFFAQEVVEQLGAFLVFAVDGDADLGHPDEIKAPSRRVAQSLVARDLGDWVPLRPLDPQQLKEWLGPAPRKIVQTALELSGGRTGEALSLWRSWLGGGLLLPTEEGGWQLAADGDLLPDAVTELTRRIDLRLSPGDAGDYEALRMALAFGALEGRSFTGKAVATAIDRDLDSVEDLLDALTEGADEAVLRGPRLIEVDDLDRDGKRALWQYEFVTPLLWRAARQLTAGAELQSRSLSMLDALTAAYGRELPAISPVLARLADDAGCPATAIRFRQMVKAPGREALMAQARYLQIVDKDGWTPADHRDAAYVFADAASASLYVQPIASLLPWAERAVRHAEIAGDVGHRAMAVALHCEGSICLRLGLRSRCETSLEAAREIAAQGSPLILIQVLRTLSDVHRLLRDDAARARATLEEALTLCRTYHNRGEEAGCKYDLAVIASHEGDLSTASAFNQEALATIRGMGDKGAEMTALHLQALIEREMGNHSAARDHVQEALRHQSAVGRTYSEAQCLRLLALIELDAGEPEKARATAEGALRLLRGIEHHTYVPPALLTLAMAMHGCGDPEAAGEQADRAAALYRALGNESGALIAERVGKNDPG